MAPPWAVWAPLPSARAPPPTATAPGRVSRGGGAPGGRGHRRGRGLRAGLELGSAGPRGLVRRASRARSVCVRVRHVCACGFACASSSAASCRLASLASTSWLSRAISSLCICTLSCSSASVVDGSPCLPAVGSRSGRRAASARGRASACASAHCRASSPFRLASASSLCCCAASCCCHGWPRSRPGMAGQLAGRVGRLGTGCCQGTGGCSAGWRPRACLALVSLWSTMRSCSCSSWSSAS